jgi:D-alanine-D-alanine ligase
MKIIVLAGGLNPERDVSLSSGAGICQALLEKGHDAFLLDVYLGLEETPKFLIDVFTMPGHGLNIAAGVSDSEPDLSIIKGLRAFDYKNFFGPNVLELCSLADIVFMGLHGGEGENGKIQAAFDLLNIKYTGSNPLSCAIAMDKGISKKLFVADGVPAPKGFVLSKDDPLPDIKDLELELPLVVKPCNGGSSIGTYIIHTPDDYPSLIAKSFKYEDEVVIEEFIKGREFSCGVLADKALFPIEIIPNIEFFDYVNKYQAGVALEICPAQLDSQTTKKMQELTLKAYRTLKLNAYGRADFMLDEKGNLFCLEVNTLPGMTPNSLFPREALAMGIDFGTLCERIIEVSFEEKYGHSPFSVL